MQQVSHKQKGRFLKKTPEKLARLLEIVNSIPTGLGSIRDRETLEVALQNVSAQFVQYATPHGLHTSQQVEDAIKRIHEADKWRAVLFSLDYLPRLEKGVRYHYGVMPLAIYCDEHGVMRLEENLLTEVFREGFEAARLGKCINFDCQRFFWKGRNDKKCCSTVCTKRFMTRKWRMNTKKYETNRVLKEIKKDK